MNKRSYADKYSTIAKQIETIQRGYDVKRYISRAVVTAMQDNHVLSCSLADRRYDEIGEWIQAAMAAVSDAQWVNTLSDESGR